MRSGREVAGGEAVESGGGEDKGEDEDGMPGLKLMDLIIIVMGVEFQ